MSCLPSKSWLVACVLAALGPSAAAGTLLQFAFSGPRDGHLPVAPDATYTPERGHGIESEHPVTGDAWFFSADVPEGNHRVIVGLRGAPGGSTVTIKAELRRWMAGPVRLDAGEERTVSFVVNVRNPRIVAANGVAAGEVRLKAPRETTQEAWAWDRRLTLEFNGERPVVNSIVIEPAEVPTIFLLGDSTVCDQSREPYSSWGQMFTGLFGEGVAIANHGESGETYRDSLGRRRIDKIVSVLRPGDWVLLQFGHNDQKQIAAGTGGPFTTYREEIGRHVAMIKRAGGVPVILSPMERRGFDAGGRVVHSLADYATAARQAAEAAGVAFIDLNALSKPLYEALGPEGSTAAFAAPEGRIDNTHHNGYGAWLLAQCVAESARAQRLGFARHLAASFGPFEPSRPPPVSTFNIPPSPLVTRVRPLGD